MTARIIPEIRETPTSIRKSLIAILVAEFFAADDEHSRLAEMPDYDEMAIAARQRIWRIRSLICAMPAMTSAEYLHKERVYQVSIGEGPHFDIDCAGCAREFQASLLSDALALISSRKEAA